MDRKEYLQSPKSSNHESVIADCLLKKKKEKRTPAATHSEASTGF